MNANTCPLRHEWESWSEEKKSDRLFMICPVCKTYGSHIASGSQCKRVQRAALRAAKGEVHNAM